MLHRRIWGALTLVSLVSFFAVACGGGDEVEVVQPGPGTGTLGESCNSKSDCVSNLSCISNVCVESAPDMPSVQLGDVGESCQSRSDCQQGLSCVANVCTDPASAPDAGSQVGSGKQGETCQTRSDCETGLTCIGGTCVTDEFGLEPTDMICVATECNVPADCLQLDEATCETYAAACDDVTPTPSTSCDYLRAYCTASNWDCTDLGQCAYVGSCTTNVYTLACPSSDSGTVCDTANDVCVQCTDLTPCAAANQECQDGVCIATCTAKEDCPFFNDCDDGTCVEVGCQTDRECVAYTRNALATCDTDTGECNEPCQTDAECDSAFLYAFRACVDGSCVDVGCETDEECRIRAGSPLVKAACVEAP